MFIYLSNRIKANRMGFITALTCFLMFGYEAYNQLNKLYPDLFIRGESTASQPITINKQFLIKTISSEQDLCSGIIASHFERTQENSYFKFNSEAQIKVGDVSYPTISEIEASFNILGQLVAGRVLTKNALGEFVVGIFNVDPIEIVLIKNMSNLPEERKKLSIPGPIILRERGKRFLLEYVPANKSVEINLVDRALNELLNLKLVESGEQALNCPNETKEPIDIIKSLNTIQNKYSGIMKLLPIDFR